jgi:hypothetical protein
MTIGREGAGRVRALVRAAGPVAALVAASGGEAEGP